MKLNGFKQVLLLAMLALIVFNCDNKSSVSNEPSEEDNCQESPVFDVSGNWVFTITVTGGSQLPVGTVFQVDVTYQQSEDGKITGRTVTEGGLTTDLQGKVCGTHVTFTLRQNEPCPGSFSGTAEITDGMFLSGSYTGRDCHGTLEANISGVMHINGNITANTTWKGKIHLFSHVTVNSNATLTIAPGTEIVLHPPETSAGRIQFIVYGNLIAKGTADRIIRFHSSSNNPTRADWNGLDIAHTDGLELEYCSIENAHTGIYLRSIDKLKTIKNCLIASCGRGLSNGSATDVQILNVSFIENGMSEDQSYYCAYFHPSNTQKKYDDHLSKCLFRGNVFDVTVDGGPRYTDSTHVFIDGSNFENSPGQPFSFDSDGYNATISISQSFGVVAVDTLIGTNRLVVQNVAENPVPDAGCGFEDILSKQ